MQHRGYVGSDGAVLDTEILVDGRSGACLPGIGGKFQWKFPASTSASIVEKNRAE